MSKLFLLFIACVLILGCGGSHHSQGLAVPLDELKSAPEVLDYSDNQVTMLADISRDFMPGSTPPGGSSLRGFFWLILSPTQLCLFLTPDLVWVINGDSAWQTEATEYQGAEGFWLIEGGPKWDTGITVDVVVRLTDEQNNVYLLRATDVLIMRSD